MKITTTHIRVNNATELFTEIAAKLTASYAERGNGRVETDDFEMDGYIWSCTAIIDTEYKTTEYRDSPPEYEYTMIDVYIIEIQCTDKEGGEIDATFFDANGREIGDDELVQVVTSLLSDKN